MRVLYASKDVITPQAFEIIKSIKGQVIPDVPLDLAPVGENPHPNSTVLALGAYKSRNGERVVAGPSVAQIVTKADIVTRLGAVFRLLTAPPELPPMEYTVLEDRQDVLDLLGGTHNRDVVVDIETSGDVDVDLPDPKRIISIALCAGGHAYVIPEELCQDYFVYWEMCRFLERNRIITVNGKFDLKYFPDADANDSFDVQVAHYCLYPASGENGLKPVTKKYFGFEDWDEPTKAYTKGATYKEAWSDPETGAWADARKYSAGSGYERIPRTLLYKYNAFDVYATWHWAEREKASLLADPEALRVFNKRMLLSGMFREVERRGFTIDTEYLLELKCDLEDDLKVAEAKLNELAGHEINPRSPKQVKAWFTAQGVDLPGTGEPVLTEFIENMGGAENEMELMEIQNAIDFAEQLMVCRGIAKNLGTYVNGFLDRAHGNTINTTFNITGPITGRIANRGAGIMTIPRDKRLRKMVIPSGPGRVLVKPDYGQLEMRIVAALSNDERFIAAFQPNMPDFFTSMMPEVYPDLDLASLSKEEHAAKRNGVKPISHGANYGRQYMAIAKQLKMDPNEARDIYNRYMGPQGTGLAAWQAEIRRKAVNSEDIVTPYGFHLQSELVTRGNRVSVENSALSFLPQSTGNDICLGAALRIHDWLGEYDAWIVATIHDQIIVDAPIEQAKAVGVRMETEMVLEGRNVFGDLLVFEAAPEYGFDWAQKMDPEDWDKWLDTTYKGL